MNSIFPASHSPVTLYRHPLSGHCHRVELMLSFLAIPYKTVDLDFANGEHKSAAYLKKSPLGQVPAIDDNGVVLSDSNAIIVYLVTQYHDGQDWYPQDSVQRAQVQRWLSVAAGEIASGPAAVRLVKLFGADLDYDKAKQKTLALFDILENGLKRQGFLATEHITLADVAAYSYIAHVPEGGVDLDPYPAIRAWLSRIEAHPRFVPMTKSPLPSA